MLLLKLRKRRDGRPSDTWGFPPTHETGSEPKGPAVTSLDGTRSEECAARSRRAQGHSSPYHPLLLETGWEPANAVSHGLSGKIRFRPKPESTFQIPKAESTNRIAAKANNPITMRSNAR